MAYVTIIEKSTPAGKSNYSSELLTNKRTELINAGDLTFTVQTLPNGNKKFKETWRNQSTFQDFNSWMTSSGEQAKMQAHDSANNITYTTS